MKPLQIYKGETRSIGCIIQRNDGGGFSITSATYEIRDYEGNVVVDEAAVDGWEDVSTTAVARYRVYKTIEFDQDPKTTLFVHFWINVSARVIAGVVEVRING
jgi:hypothetical protein